MLWSIYALHIKAGRIETMCAEYGVWISVGYLEINLDFETMQSRDQQSMISILFLISKVLVLILMLILQLLISEFSLEISSKINIVIT